MISFLILFISMAFLNLNKLETSHTIRWLMEIDIIINILIETKFIKNEEVVNTVILRNGFKRLKDFCQMTPLDFLDIFPICDLHDLDFVKNSLSPLSNFIIFFFFKFFIFLFVKNFLLFYLFLPFLTFSFF